MTIIVTGAAGFIGSNFVLNWFEHQDEKIVALDKLTYAGNLENLKSVETNKNYEFVHGDIGDSKLISELLQKHKPRAIVNFAAESHVDRSIDAPGAFLKTNIMGTYNLLEKASIYFGKLNADKKRNFRFLHISTDEVYGSLNLNEPSFHESSPYKPNSPYSASKASSDHLVRAWHHTYNLPVLTTSCSNNYGPHQHCEKFIPMCIKNCINNEKITIYGDGKQIRDWLFVHDHCEAISLVLSKGNVGHVYNIGGNNEITNLDLAYKICDLMNKIYKSNINLSYRRLIEHIKDRPGHDFRYSINSEKIFKELGWKPSESFESGLKKTIEWYLEKSNFIKINIRDV